jgi:hypothetical protein
MINTNQKKNSPSPIQKQLLNFLVTTPKEISFYNGKKFRFAHSEGNSKKKLGSADYSDTTPKGTLKKLPFRTFQGKLLKKRVSANCSETTEEF